MVALLDNIDSISSCFHHHVQLFPYVKDFKEIRLIKLLPVLNWIFPPTALASTAASSWIKRFPKKKDIFNRNI